MMWARRLPATNFAKIKGPADLKNRYFSEDIPYGIAPGLLAGNGGKTPLIGRSAGTGQLPAGVRLLGKGLLYEDLGICRDDHRGTQDLSAERLIQPGKTPERKEKVKMSFHSIKPAELQENLFDLIGKDWFLMSAEKDGRVNPMTVAWATMGILWQKPVVICAVRPDVLPVSFGCFGCVQPDRI